MALVGHNGAGKTTLMKLMLGLLRPSAGSVRVLGDDPATNGFAIRRRLGYLPENVSLNPALTGRETLAFYARLKGERVADAATLLDQVGIAGAASRRVATYSKGMRQRLGLAQALIGRPLILLLDEPTTGFDPELRQRFYEIIEEVRNRGATVLLSSHALAELGRYADRVIVMNRGRLVADGTLDALRRIARLPTRIRVTLKNGELDEVSRQLASVSPWRRVNGEVIETDAAPDSKIEILRRVAEHPADRRHRGLPADARRCLRSLHAGRRIAVMNVLTLAGKEIREGLRNRWVLAATLLLALLALTLTFLGSAPTGSVGVQPLDVVIVSLSSLTIFLVPLIALLLSHDAIVGEVERGTMLLLLSYPVARWQVVLGKFAGHLAILGFSTVVGYGAAMLAFASTGKRCRPRVGRRSPR